MGRQAFVEADQRDRYQSGLSRSRMMTLRQWGTTAASNVTNLAPSNAFTQSVGWTEGVPLQQYNNLGVFVFLSLVSSTSVDIHLQLANSAAATYYDVTRRSISGGVPLIVDDFDRVTASLKEYNFRGLGGPYVRFQVRQNGGSNTCRARIAIIGLEEGA